MQSMAAGLFKADSKYQHLKLQVIFSKILSKVSENGENWRCGKQVGRLSRLDITKLKWVLWKHSEKMNKPAAVGFSLWLLVVLRQLKILGSLFKSKRGGVSSDGEALQRAGLSRVKKTQHSIVETRFELVGGRPSGNVSKASGDTCLNLSVRGRKRKVGKVIFTTFLYNRWNTTSARRSSCRRSPVF